MSARWLSLSATVAERHQGRVSDHLIAAGSTGITEHHDGLVYDDDDGPLVTGDPRDWHPPVPPSPDARVRLTGWFTDDGRGPLLHAELCALLHALGEPADATLDVVPDQDWNAAWKKHFGPTRVAPGVWVVPHWCAVPPDAEGDLVLHLDPGLAFGTGTHPTTGRCVELLRSALGERPGASVFDVGTGTGILALAALGLGAASAVGVDPDPRAVEAARENAVRNGAVDRFEVALGSADAGPPGAHPVVVANLIAPLLERLAAPIAARTAPGGALILSGLLLRQRAAVLDAFPAFTVDTERTRDGWCALLLRKSA